jgi:hypothetical protein
MGEQGNGSGNPFEIVERDWEYNLKFLNLFQVQNFIAYRKSVEDNFKLRGRLNTTLFNGDFSDDLLGTYIPTDYFNTNEWSNPLRIKDSNYTLGWGAYYFGHSPEDNSFIITPRNGFRTMFNKAEAAVFTGKYVRSLVCYMASYNIFFTDENKVLYVIDRWNPTEGSISGTSVYDLGVKYICGCRGSTSHIAVGYLKENGELYTEGAFAGSDGYVYDYDYTYRECVAKDVVDFHVNSCYSAYLTKDGDLFFRGSNAMSLNSETFGKYLEGTLFGESYGDYIQEYTHVDEGVVKICVPKGVFNQGCLTSFCYLKANGELIGCGYHVYDKILGLSSSEYAQHRYVIATGVTNAWESQGSVFYVKGGCTYVFGRNYMCALGIGEPLSGSPSNDYTNNSDTPVVYDPIKIADEEAEYVQLIPYLALSNAKYATGFDTMRSLVKYWNKESVFCNGIIYGLSDSVTVYSGTVEIELPQD